MPEIRLTFSPGLDYMPEIRFGLLQGLQNNVPDPIQTFARSEFYARDSIWIFAGGAKHSPRFGSDFCQVGILSP